MKEKISSAEALVALRRSGKAFISSREAARVMEVDPYWLYLKAKNGCVPFPVYFSGRRLKISRVGFLAWYDGKTLFPEDAPPRKGAVV